MRKPLTNLLMTATLAAALNAQSQLVAPAAYTNIDALSYEWLPGASFPQRQLILIGQSHLQPMVGSTIQALEFRRTTEPEKYSAGAMDWKVQMSLTPRAPVNCSRTFTQNVGPNPVLVYRGTVNLPASPATGGPQTPITWQSQNVLRVQLTTPFLYTGGTLCIDITGTPIQGASTWWMADAVEAVMPGYTVTEIGAGCGSYGGPSRRWSRVVTRSLVPGGHALFSADGPANGPALAMFGTGMPNALPLSLLGIGTPNCFCHLDPAAILAMLPAVFEPPSQPSAFPTNEAVVTLPLPADPAMFGLQLTTQWFDLTQQATSNALTWTIASAVPTLDMALVEGNPAGSTGNVSTDLAHVLRFEYQ